MTTHDRNVSMYKEPPDGYENLMKMVEGARERLNLYKMLQDNQSLEEIKTHLVGSPLIFLIQKSDFCKVQEARRIDYLSHWTLRLAYCSDDAHMHFIKYELKWFKMRFDLLADKEKLEFISENGFVLTSVSEEQKAQLSLTPGETFYKFRFTEAPLLVRSRECLIRHGYIYVPLQKIVYWLLNKLETQLKASATHIKKTLPTAEIGQLRTVFSFINLVKPVGQYALVNNPVPLEQLDEEAKFNFPLCMKFQHETLRRTHHLKYFSRMQYGLFLKGLGLSLADALKFWKDEFKHDMSEERFMRKYSYLFKHQYGTVGSRIDYAPYNCEQIIGRNVGPNQIHGCPYKQWNEEVLVKKLKQWQVSEHGIEAIVDLKRKRRFTGACAKYFECVHECKPDGAIVHPNQYYLNGRKCGEVDMEDFFNVESDSEQ